jgi:putative aldouronate transport system substrate-binding protein
VFTDLVVNNPDYEFSLCLIKYTSSTPASICINERNYLGYTDAQKKAVEVWLRNTESTQAPGSIWTTDAQNEYDSIATDLGSFVSTYCLQFITGSKSMDEWDAFVDEALSSFDVDRLTELSQEAVEAYLAKG